MIVREESVQMRRYTVQVDAVSRCYYDAVRMNSLE